MELFKLRSEREYILSDASQSIVLFTFNSIKCDQI